jgi:hypothetical protein
LDWVAEQLGISYDDEWYGVSMSELQRLSGRKILDFYGGSLYNALTACYPGNISLFHNHQMTLITRKVMACVVVSNSTLGVLDVMEKPQKFYGLVGR